MLNPAFGDFLPCTYGSTHSSQVRSAPTAVFGKLLPARVLSQLYPFLFEHLTHLLLSSSENVSLQGFLFVLEQS